MVKVKKEITNNELYGLVEKLDSKLSKFEKIIISNSDLIKLNSEQIKVNSEQIKLNTDLIKRNSEDIKSNAELIDSLARAVNEGFENNANRLNTIEEGIEDIRLRMDNVAYSFELKENTRRLDKLEIIVNKLYPN